MIQIDDYKFNIRENSFDSLCIDEIWKSHYYTANNYTIPQGGNILDIGGHIGVFSLYAVKYGAGKVYAYEPDQDNFKYLTENISLNNARNVYAFNSAVTVLSENYSMSDSNQLDNNGVKHTGLGKIGAGNTIVKGVSFKSVLEQEEVWDLLKIDIEGYEYDLLYCVSDKLLARIKAITMEFHHDVESETEAKGLELLAFLESKGFSGNVSWSYGNQGRLQAKRND